MTTGFIKDESTRETSECINFRGLLAECSLDREPFLITCEVLGLSRGDITVIGSQLEKRSTNPALRRRFCASLRGALPAMTSFNTCALLISYAMVATVRVSGRMFIPRTGQLNCSAWSCSEFPVHSTAMIQRSRKQASGRNRTRSINTGGDSFIATVYVEHQEYVLPYRCNGYLGIVDSRLQHQLHQKTTTSGSVEKPSRRNRHGHRSPFHIARESFRKFLKASARFKLGHQDFTVETTPEAVIAALPPERVKSRHI